MFEKNPLRRSHVSQSHRMVLLLQRYSKQSLYKSPISNFTMLQDCLTQFPALLSYHPPASRNRETKPPMLLVRLMTSCILLVRARAVFTHLCLSCLCCTPFIPRYRASPLHHHQHKQTHKPHAALPSPSSSSVHSLHAYFPYPHKY